MPRDLLRSPLRLLTSGLLLLLAACGPAISEAEVAPASEPLGTQESALCSGLSVTTLGINGISSYQGEAAGNGPWAVSSGANAVRLEYYLNGSFIYNEERMGTSGTWYFSHQPLSCGVTYTFMVKAMPMVVDSIGNRTTCISNSRTTSQSFSEACPGGSCQGMCGSSSTNCWCDSYCTQYGDCCPDYQTWCGGSTGCPGSTCGDGSCCPPSGQCSDGTYCPL